MTYIPDRLTLLTDSETRKDVRADLCESCSTSLLTWLDPPEAVRVAWQARGAGGPVD